MRYFFSIIIYLALAVCTFAQSKDDTVEQRYNKALSLYNNGKFDQCQEIAKPLAKDSKEIWKTNAYRLLALCCIANDDISGARTYVDLMLKNDPYFTYSLGDPQRFIDLINENKSREAGITTASRQEESLDEAPVAVTLITEDMIRHSGATTLQELLCLYVPGMTVAEGVETNIAMHGIYSFWQDKILVMVDGHRLNSSATNGEALDYRTSLDKIQQIEVLRGPASSLYGNVALTAVVNIITHKGAQMNGGRLTALVGTQNTYGGSFIVGGGNNVLDIMGWGSIFYSKGFESTVDKGITGADAGTTTLYSNGFRGRPSYDIGIKGRWKDFTMSVNLQSSKRVPYMNILQVPASESISSILQGETNFDAYRNYSYDRYPNINGNEPGVTRSNRRVNLDYAHSFDKFDIQASGYISFETTTLYNVLGDSVNDDEFEMPVIGKISIASAMTNLLSQTADDAGYAGAEFSHMISELVGQKQYAKKGAFQIMDWNGITYGLQAQGMTDYHLLGHGNVTLGVQYDGFSLSSSSFIFGGYFSGAGSISSNAIFKGGNENSISGYLQLKHYIAKDRVIFNAGLRYDHKNRFNDENIDKFSPRFSVVWKLTNKVSFRGNYNYSFVDAPYAYRASILKIFGGGSNMRPETMQSFNLGATYYDPRNHLIAELSGFYNILNDLTIMDTSIADLDLLNKKITYDYMFRNAGKVRNVGVDASLQYTQNRFFGNFNATWQRVVTSERYIVYNSQTYSTPEFHINATAAWAPYQGKGYASHSKNILDGGKLWVRGTVQFQTGTYYRTLDLVNAVISNITSLKQESEQINYVAPQCNIGLGVSYECRFFDVDVTLKNLLNNTYMIGSMLNDGVPHAGRQLIAKLTWRF